MKKLISCVASLMVCAYAYGQGEVLFQNRVPPDINALVTLNGVGVSDGWTAQLYGGPAGSATAALKPLTPTTTFRTGAGAGYTINGTVVQVPGVAQGANATLMMVAYNGATYESSLGKGASTLITVGTGGGTIVPGNLTGLQPFTVTIVPEPSTIALGMLGAGALLFIRRRK